MCLVNGEGKRRKLPAWTRFYAGLGSFLACDEDTDSKITFGLALPVRTFASVFCALGLVRRLALKSPDPAADYFKYLMGLPPGTPVTYLKGQKKYKGILKPRPRSQELGIQIENERSGNTTWIIDSSMKKKILRISPLEVEKISLPRHQQGRQIRTETSFIEAFAFGVDVEVYLAGSTLDVLLVGNKTTLKAEICDTPFAVGMAKGRLNEVLRVHSFLSSYENFRTEVCSSSGMRSPALPLGMVPHTVIFDGARGFLKWHSSFARSHQVVLLEQSEPRFEDAVYLLVEQSLSRYSEVDLSVLPEPPPGVELIAWRKRT